MQIYRLGYATANVYLVLDFAADYRFMESFDAIGEPYVYKELSLIAAAVDSLQYKVILCTGVARRDTDCQELTEQSQSPRRWRWTPLIPALLRAMKANFTAFVNASSEYQYYIDEEKIQRVLTSQY